VTLPPEVVYVTVKPSESHGTMASLPAETRVPDGQVGAGTLVIHRVVGGSERTGYVRRGDNTGGDDAWRPRSDDVVGKVRWKLPLVGRMLVFLRTPLGMAAFAALVAFALAFPAAAKKPEAERPAS